MNILRFCVDGKVHIGKLVDGYCISLASSIPGFPENAVKLIAEWPRWREAAAVAAGPSFALDTVELLAPIERPGKMLTIGLNYAAHIAEAGGKNFPQPTAQTWFCKQATSINGPYHTIEIPGISNQVDCEVELVAIIGKRGRHIALKQAEDYVFGYCIGNDFTVRDWQRASTQWMLAKSFDTHGPIGPWITTRDEVGDPHALDLRCLVNGEIRQNSNTRHLLFNVWAQIAHLSTAMTLEPGDVIFTGTPEGVGSAMKPPCYLKDGDIVRCEIDGLGAIENRCVQVS